MIERCIGCAAGQLCVRIIWWFWCSTSLVAKLQMHASAARNAPTLKCAEPELGWLQGWSIVFLQNQIVCLCTFDCSTVFCCPYGCKQCTASVCLCHLRVIASVQLHLHGSVGDCCADLLRGTPHRWAVANHWRGHHLCSCILRVVQCAHAACSPASCLYDKTASASARLWACLIIECLCAVRCWRLGSLAARSGGTQPGFSRSFELQTIVHLMCMLCSMYLQQQYAHWLILLATPCNGR